MQGLVTIEGIGARAETGGDPAAFHRPAGRRHGRVELAIQQQVFERAQALLLTFDFLSETMERVHQLGRIRRRAVFSGPPMAASTEKLNSRASSPAMRVRREPRALSRIICACIWPSRCANALRCAST